MEPSQKIKRIFIPWNSASQIVKHAFMEACSQNKKNMSFWISNQIMSQFYNQLLLMFHSEMANKLFEYFLRTIIWLKIWIVKVQV